MDFLITHSPSSGLNRKITPRNLGASFGDGYGEITPDGINTTLMELEPEWKLLSFEEADRMDAFFRASHGKSFVWKHPRESFARVWRCSEWNLQDEQTTSVITAKFREQPPTSDGEATGTAVSMAQEFGTLLGILTPAEMSSFVQSGLDYQFSKHKYRIGNSYSSSVTGLSDSAFSRASTGVAQSADGTYTSFGFGVPRITDLGILIEATRTNLTPIYSANPSESAGFVGNPVGMGKTGDAAAILSVVGDGDALAAAGLSGICTSGKVYKLDNTAGAATAFATFGAGIVLSGVNTNVSVFVRGGAGSLRNTSSSGEGQLLFSASTGYIRRSVQMTTAANRTPAVSASPGEIIYFILPQVEVGAFRTSPIITVGSSAVRATDILNVVGLSNVLGYPFSLVIDYTRTAGTGYTASHRISSLSGTAGNSFDLYQRAIDDISVTYATVNSVQQGTAVGHPASSDGIRHRQVLYATSSGFRQAVDGSSPIISTATLTPVLSSLHVGSYLGSTPVLNGFIRSITIVPGTRTNDQLRAMSTIT